SLYMTTASTLSKTLSSLGQPPVTTVASIGNPLSVKHFARSMQPAACSCAPKPWLGGPAMKRIFFFKDSAEVSLAFGAERAEKVQRADAVIARLASRNRKVFIILVLVLASHFSE